MKIIIDARTHASITKSSRNIQEEHFFTMNEQTQLNWL